MPLWDVDECVAEAQRTAAKGAKAISFPENPVPLGLPSFHTDHWDRFLEEAQRVHPDTPVETMDDLAHVFHSGTSRR